MLPPACQRDNAAPHGRAHKAVPRAPREFIIRAEVLKKMGVNGIQHYNIAAGAELIERVKDFYVEALGFKVGHRPGFMRGGFWLYAGGEPLVHLGVRGEGDARAGEASADGALDHVAFSCEGLADFVARLERAGVPYTADEVPSLRQVQLFLRDPAGVGVELNFTGESLAPEGRA
jgi:glyoxylase I family protein